MNSYVEIISKDFKSIARLGNAFSIGYHLKMNGVDTASFSLPLEDPKNEYCDPFQYYVNIIDDGEKLGPFRILPSTLQKSDMGQYTYECEHVIATLLDDIMPRHHQIGNIGIFTSDVLEYVLSFQTVKSWKLGRCAFARQFEYGWENEKLLNALFSVPKQFASNYIWNLDTSSYPWTIHLDVYEWDRIPECEVRYGKNMLSMEKRVSAENIVTRLLPLGYGEGVNQLNIAEVNNGDQFLYAKPDRIAKYGLITDTFVDRRFEIAENLKERAQIVLDEMQDPYIEYTVGVADISSATGNPLDKPRPAKTVRVIDNIVNEDFKTVIKEVVKSDIIGQPMACRAVLANKPQDIAAAISDIATRQRIEEVYAQGNTVPMTFSFSDNADEEHPLIVFLYVPNEAKIINKILLTWRIQNYRSTVVGTQVGGAKTGRTGDANAGGSISSASAGGTIGQWSGANISVSGAVTGVSTANTGGSNMLSESTRISAQNTADALPSVSFNTGGMVSHTASYAGTMTNSVQSHQHYVEQHTHGGTANSAAWKHSHSMQHTHHTPLYSHSHTINQFNISLSSGNGAAAHTHSFSGGSHGHSFSPNAHSHTFSFEGHEHGIVYGIAEQGRASTISIRADGTEVPFEENAREVNITAYLATDDEGKILRGTWHEIEFVPDKRTRIIGSVYSQIFIQSRGGGVY